MHSLLHLESKTNYIVKLLASPHYLESITDIIKQNK